MSDWEIKRYNSIVETLTTAINNAMTFEELKKFNLMIENIFSDFTFRYDHFIEVTNLLHKYVNRKLIQYDDKARRTVVRNLYEHYTCECCCSFFNFIETGYVFSDQKLYTAVNKRIRKAMLLLEDKYTVGKYRKNNCGRTPLFIRYKITNDMDKDISNRHLIYSFRTIL